MEKVDMAYLQDRATRLEKRIETEKARDAQQTVGLLETELKVIRLAIIGAQALGR